jgi:enoyl-CoA hydratase/carnithine racemase
VGKSKAIELMAAGELFDFEKGETLGLINRIVDASDAADFMKQALDYARQFTTPRKAARARRQNQARGADRREIPFESALALERELQQQLFTSEDAKEGWTRT